ncbi:hypothetical protein MO867_18295 [Microbulbifer sp. OS29]|uniref:Uncharacterized protein n=1 Tax=Microbulbifer okhotskensis TaxID=2926617 RepID=A0A9X2J957_9GAMM|nr:hypothetical protein [Microbulbifer okhotskensis]MCO1336286.1 hypothetical protein [Microbulbifer okhotskensis]
MRRITLLMCLLLSSAVHAEENQEKGVAEAAKSVVSGIVSFSKDLVGGASEGVADGRKSGKSTDGAILVNTHDDFIANLEAKIITIISSDEGGCYVEIGFKNNNELPVRLIDLKESEAIIVIDEDGYAINLFNGRGNPEELTIPSNAGRKQQFYFATNWDEVKEVRILGEIIEL